MSMHASLRFALIGAGFLAAACSGPAVPYFTAEYEPWRNETELACLRSGSVQPTYFLAAQPRLDGPKVCGAERPFEMSAAGGGMVELSPPARLRCPMVPAVEAWVRDAVVPAAYRQFGQPVIAMTVAASYSCRPMNNMRGGRLSEHGYANALDISAFTLADGRKVSVLDGWNGGYDERAFLREVHEGACGPFTTVLGPEHDRAHADHFHFDLRQRRNAYCK